MRPPADRHGILYLDKRELEMALESAHPFGWMALCAGAALVFLLFRTRATDVVAGMFLLPALLLAVFGVAMVREAVTAARRRRSQERGQMVESVMRG